MIRITARTARVPHHCEACATLGANQPPTITPGHRYLLHTSFPDGYTDTSPHPWSVKECIGHAEERDQSAGMLVAGACTGYCCGDEPCARPFGHPYDEDHSCRRCATTPTIPLAV